MPKLLFLLFLFLSSSELNAQTRDYSGWFNFGSSHVNKWLWIAPAKLGPNALPVPRMNYALLPLQSSIEIGADTHLMKGDEGFNSYVNFKWNVANERVMIEFWGNPTETFWMSNKVRDERQIYYDDEGWITHQGDLWISTYIQLLKNKEKLPDIVANYSMSLTTGLSKHGRYTDAPIFFFYLTAGKSFYPSHFFFDEIRIALLGGTYIWQTNKVEIAQDEGPLGEIGLLLRKGKLNMGIELAGYMGHDAYNYHHKTGNNDPLIFRNRLEYQWKKMMLKAEYQIGLHDYHYKTFRLSGTFFF